MTVPQRVQRHRQAEANRRKVATRGTRVPRPQARNPRPSRRTVRRTAATTGFLGLLTAICSFGGAVFTVAGAVTTAAGGVTVAWIEYRRDLIEVRRTGKPIQDPGAKPPAKPVRPKSEPTGSTSAEPRGPMEAQWLAQQRATPQQPRARKPPAGKAIHRHADGTPCRAKSDKTCRKGGAQKRKPGGRK